MHEVQIRYQMVNKQQASLLSIFEDGVSEKKSSNTRGGQGLILIHGKTIPQATSPTFMSLNMPFSEH